MENSNMKLETSETTQVGETQVLESNQLLDSMQKNSVSNSQLSVSDIQLVQTQNQALSVSGSWSSPYQMMLLPSGIQSNMNGNVFTLQDGNLVFSSIADSAQETSNLGQQVLQTSNLLSSKQDQEITSPPQTLTESQPPPVQKTEKPKLPKKPLNTYMLFSKAIWPQVKAANSHLSSVTEIGAIVGAIWRELDASQKQQYNEYFMKDKERYENELKAYRQMTGLSETDAIKPPNKKKCKEARSLPSTSTTTSVSWGNNNIQNSTQQPQQLTPTSTNNNINNLNTSANSNSNASSASTTPVLPQDPLRPQNSEVSLSSDQLLNQQILANLATNNGQLLLASDGNFDNNIANLLALHSQSLPTTQLNISGERQVDNLVSNLISGDQTLVWPQCKLENQSDLSLQVQQPLTTDLLKDNPTIYFDDQQKQFFLKNENGTSTLITGIDPTTGVLSLDPVPTREQLEAELQQLRSALTEKTNQVNMLTTRLEEAKQIIEHYQQQMSQLAGVTEVPSDTVTSIDDNNTNHNTASSTTTTDPTNEAPPSSPNSTSK